MYKKKPIVKAFIPMLLKYKKRQNLHNFPLKLPTSVGVKMCIFAHKTLSTK